MANEYEEIGPSESFHGLLVKISSKAGGGVGGKLYLFPQQSLSAFEFKPKDMAAFDNAFRTDRLVDVDYAVYRPGIIVYGSAG